MVEPHAAPLDETQAHRPRMATRSLPPGEGVAQRWGLWRIFKSPGGPLSAGSLWALLAAIEHLLSDLTSGEIDPLDSGRTRTGRPKFVRHRPLHKWTMGW